MVTAFLFYSFLLHVMFGTLYMTVAEMNDLLKFGYIFWYVS